MSFIQFARAHGVVIENLTPSDRIQRCATVNKPKQKNGAYFWDGDRGWVFCWDDEAKTQWYEDPNAKPWTDEEKRVWAMKRQTMAAEQQRKYENAALRAAVMLRSTKPDYHDYLARKHLPDVRGLVLPGGELFVPMRNLSTNELQGAQIIKWIPDELRWEKKMLPGMRAKGAVLRLGPRTATEACYCEGYATGLSIELAARQVRLSAAVWVCFSDSNMVHVAGLMKESKLRRYVFADNDKSGAGERAAKETGLSYCMSEQVGFDANDLHARDGLMSVQALLMKARSG